VAEILSGLFPVVTINAPGTLDGGDVMILADKVFVGRSGRTNTDGIDQLTRVASGQGMPVVVVPVEGVLHLKSAVLPVDGETVVVTPGTVDTSLLSDLRIVDEAEAERHGFSALPLASGEVLVTDGAPDTSSRLAALGMSIVPIDVSEIMAADGGLTCMSILY
jgi:dimethylargininase